MSALPPKADIAPRSFFPITDGGINHWTNWAVRPISKVQTQQNEGDWTMSNAKKIALSAAIILSTAFSALTVANAGVTVEQARNGPSGGTGVANYDRDGGIVSGNWR